MNTKIVLLFLSMIALLPELMAQQKVVSVSSPDQHIKVEVSIADGKASYSVAFNNAVVLKPSKLGLVLEEEDFSEKLSFVSASAIEKISEQYNMVYAKRKSNVYKANKMVLHLANKNDQPMDIVFQVSNDGLAFQYVFTQDTRTFKTVLDESTTYHFPTTAKAWLQPMQVAKTGWESTNPAYEENYLQDIPVGTPSPNPAGWVYPALFKINNTWVLLTEAALDGKYCATRLNSLSPDGEYKIGFPGKIEVFTGKGNLPVSFMPFTSPWRVVTIGSLKTIMESAMGTDLAKKQVSLNMDFVKPGKSSWSWINSKDDFIIYDEQKKYIDYAADMHWSYCLVDADWDRKIGYEKIKELADYAKTKNVGLLLWYNSAGSWNSVKYTPKDKLLTHESRVKEFARLKEMGIKGVKIDFFGGDGQSVIRYYIDILNDAADAQLMVNFHGATLPRGWARTYPHLMTAEAVKGFEAITFRQNDADVEANHCAMLPFARNVFDPMDFTPMNLYKIQTNVKRKTTGGFELALSVLFLSGIQHFAESPEGMAHVPEFVKNYLRVLPDSWDDVKFIEGDPGKYVVLARKSSDKWYLCGINAQTKIQKVSIDLSAFRKAKAQLITDGEGTELFAQQNFKVSGNKVKTITLKPSSGFVIVLE